MRYAVRILSTMTSCCLLILAHAGSHAPLPIEELAKAELVILGDFDGKTTHQDNPWDPEAGIPYIEQVVAVRSCLRPLEDPSSPEAPATCPDSVIVRAIGGRVPSFDEHGNRTIGPDGAEEWLVVDDNDAMPRLQRGEQVLFLSRRGAPTGQFCPYGNREGMLPVLEDAGGTRTVTLSMLRWELLSEAGKASAVNNRIKAIRENGGASGAPSPVRKGSLPPGPYYRDTVPVDRLEVLLEKVPGVTRSTS